MSAYPMTNSNGEIVVLGTAGELADLLEQDYPRWLEYGCWTDQQGRFMLCRTIPAPAYTEISRAELFRVAEKQSQYPGVV